MSVYEQALAAAEYTCKLLEQTTERAETENQSSRAEIECKELQHKLSVFEQALATVEDKCKLLD